MRHIVAAHAVDRSGCARANRIGIAARILGGYRDGPIRTAHDGALVVKRIGAAEIEDEAGVLCRARKGDGGASFDTEGFVGLGARRARSSASGGSLAASDVDRARGRSGTAGVLRGTNAGRIGGRANIILDLFLGVLANDVEVQE